MAKTIGSIGSGVLMEMTGDWNEFIEYLRTKPTEFTKYNKYVGEEFAHDAMNAVKNVIAESKGLEPLSEHWATIRTREGTGTLPLVRHGGYVNSFEVEEDYTLSSAGRGSWGFRVAPNDEMHKGHPKSSPITNYELGGVHEYGGSNNVPERAHWRVVMQDQAEKKFIDAMQFSVEMVFSNKKGYATKQYKTFMNNLD